MGEPLEGFQTIFLTYSKGSSEDGPTSIHTHMEGLARSFQSWLILVFDSGSGDELWLWRSTADGELILEILLLLRARAAPLSRVETRENNETPSDPTKI